MGVPASDDSEIEPLTDHLAFFALASPIDASQGGSLIEALLNRSPVDVRRSFLRAVGSSANVMRPLAEGVAPALQAMLEARMPESQRGDLSELETFGWWFASGMFDTTWSLEQLRRILDAGIRVEPETDVAVRLAALSTEFPADCVEILDRWIELGPTQPWFTFAARSEITTILASAVASGGAAADAAHRTASRLALDGHGDFLPSGI